MSVYTSPQQQSQQAYDPQPEQVPCLGQQAYGQQGIGQQPWFSGGPGQQHYAQQPTGHAGQTQIPVLITELALRCAATAATAVVEQLRMDPQIMMGIQMQGQIPAQAWSSVMAECSRRIAPVLHSTLAPFIQQNPIGQQGFGQPGQYGPAIGQPQNHYGQPAGLSM